MFIPLRFYVNCDFQKQDEKNPPSDCTSVDYQNNSHVIFCLDFVSIIQKSLPLLTKPKI